MPKLIDVHTHMHFAVYEDPKSVIDRALAAGVWVVNVGTQKDTSRGAVETAEKYSEGVYAAIGLHPIHTDKSFHDEKELGGGEAAKEFTSRGEIFDFSYYKSLGESSKVVAIGECGLDYYRLSEESKAKQFQAFEAQVELSHALNKPLMIHCRNAFSDLIVKLKEMKNKLIDKPGIIHFFTGTIEDAKELMDLGFYFSFGGVTTFPPKKGKEAFSDYDDVVKSIGLDRIVLETDAPYVAPTPFRGKRNESSYIGYVADGIAKILREDSETVARVTTENARKVLKI